MPGHNSLVLHSVSFTVHRRLPDDTRDGNSQLLWRPPPPLTVSTQQIQNHLKRPINSQKSSLNSRKHQSSTYTLNPALIKFTSRSTQANFCFFQVHLQNYRITTFLSILFSLERITLPGYAGSSRDETVSGWRSNPRLNCESGPARRTGAARLFGESSRSLPQQQQRERGDDKRESERDNRSRKAQPALSARSTGRRTSCAWRGAFLLFYAN